MRCRMRCVAFVPGQYPRRGQRGHLQAQPDQCAPVRVEIVRIGHAVAPDVRPRRVLRIRPPVITFGEIIMFAACAARARETRDGDGLLVKIFVCCGQNAVPVDRCEVRALSARFFAKAQSGHENAGSGHARQRAKLSSRYHFILALLRRLIVGKKPAYSTYWGAAFPSRTVIVRSARMSREDDPTMSLYFPGAIRQLCVFTSQ